MEAVMIPFQRYENLSMLDEVFVLDEVFERFEIAHDIQSRMNRYDSSKSVGWELIKED